MKKWIWVEQLEAEKLALSGDPALEVLRIGHGFLDNQQFATLLGKGELKVIAFRNQASALVTLGKCLEGNVLNILTVQGTIQNCEEAMPLLEEAAREIEINLIISVGYKGWARVLKRQGYDIEPRLLMRKVLK